jgi:hypothetical protein
MSHTGWFNHTPRFENWSLWKHARISTAKRLHHKAHGCFNPG